MKTITKRIILSVLILTIVFCLIVGIFLIPPEYGPIAFPDGKKFAFTICDDTDMATVENIKPVYDYLYDLGMRTTKTVWVLPTNDSLAWPNRGETLNDSAYTRFILDLKEKGFEIALHGCRGGSSQRAEIINSLENYNDIIGEYPKIHINHYINKDNLYWGVDKLDLIPLKILYILSKANEKSYGHIPESEYFWGDVARNHISYVVNFSFNDINTYKVNPLMPYYDPEKSYVNYWFHTSYGSDVNEFNELLGEENLDRLEEEGGICIVYTHFAYGFCVDGILNEVTRERLQDLAGRDGWFVPAGEILDFLKQRHRGNDELTFRQKIYIELRWTLERIL
jgi:hypothetical protein